MQLFTMDADGSNVKRLTDAPNCYNGGPFFSPDATKVIFRADRKEKHRLQLYVINSDGTGEKALTAEDKWVSVLGTKFWYKDGKHSIIPFTGADNRSSSEIELNWPNYDLWWMNLENGKRTRITFAPGADVLPVFSPDYTKVMWTRSPDGRSPSQLYIADFTPPKE